MYTSLCEQFAPWNQLDTEKVGVDQVARAKYDNINVTCYYEVMGDTGSCCLMMISRSLIMYILFISSLVEGREDKKTS